ncbi:MAG: DUF2380 domain-containing protein [Gammaproteobacteria bacterium]|nr:DUF2380 domain-containing protein [Gammaproteobacteria bacterium]
MLGAAALPARAAASPPSIVAIDFALRDDMTPGPGGKAPGAADVARRTRMIRDFFAEQLAGSENFTQLALERDSDSYRELMNASGRLFECKRCIVKYGEQLGSDYVLHGWVQRVSNLIINLNVEILEVASGKVYDRATVDTRGNTDKTWMDGASYLLRHLRHEL